MEKAKVELIYYTKDYPKLIEMVARLCYQSFDKVNESSHSFIKGILAKGHLSIASVGNIVFAVTGINTQIMKCMLRMKEINNFIRWTIPDDETKKTIISMNLLSMLDLKNTLDSHELPLVETFLEQIMKIDDLAWFFKSDVNISPKQNCYTALKKPNLYDPVLLSEDYTELAKLGFTKEQLDVHATITVNFVTDRSSGLQLWRHTDMTGGTELSQRYVLRSNAIFREMLGFSKSDTNHLDISNKIYNIYKKATEQYAEILEELKIAGIHQSRAKEVARSILPNAVVTEIIHCRPLKQWRHLFKLRDSVHAQKEVCADVQSIKKVFIAHKIDRI